VIEAGEHLPGMAALWDVATPEERREVVVLMLEPGGFYYDMEQKIMAAVFVNATFIGDAIAEETQADAVGPLQFGPRGRARRNGDTRAEDTGFPTLPMLKSARCMEPLLPRFTPVRLPSV